MSTTTTTTTSSATTVQSILPRDARLIALLLSANGAEDCEEGVIRMLVEFAHRYTTDILTDSLIYAEHAKAGMVTTGGAAAVALAASQPLVPSLEDIRLAVQARTEGGSVSKEFLLNLATTLNASPLPPIPEIYGIRLPPTSNRLTAPNFSLVPPTITTTQEDEEGNGEGDGEGEEEAEGSMEDEGEEGGLFGEDEEEDAEGEGEEDDEDEDDDDDEEMEDVTMEDGNGAGGSGFMDSSSIMSGNGEKNGLKRKAEEEENENENGDAYEYV